MKHTHTAAAFCMSAASLFALQIAAQNWCPTGAVWEYNFSAGPSIGCETRSYVGDTLIEGEICQRIQVHTIVYDHIDQQTDTFQQTIRTHVQDGVVTLAAFAGQPLVQWDTLYWFSAPVGARWRPPGSEGEPTDWCGAVEVLSIEERMIAGELLEVRNLGQLDADGTVLFEGPEMIERLGTPLMHIPVLCPVGELFGSLLHYSDATWIGYQSEEENNCDQGLGIALSEQHTSLQLVASGDQLTVTWPWHEASTLLLYNGRGQLVLRAGAFARSTLIHTANFAPGPYIVVVQGPQKQRASATWLRP